MKIVTARFDDDAGVQRAIETLHRIGVSHEMISVSGGARGLQREHGDHRAPSGAPHGGMIVTAEVADEVADAAGAAMRRGGGSGIEVLEAGGMGSMGRTAPASDASALHPAAGEDSEANDWNASERIERVTDMGEGAAAGGVMGAPLGAGTTYAAGGILGATPREEAASDTEEAEDLLQSDDVADMERRRRRADPAP
ncbi:MAG: hypothetical protein DIU80_005940 [Chloroflexota bacterium]|nr:MAG: hypothetical protein DIU80_06185 [Chloroflexota bacterium]